MRVIDAMLAGVGEIFMGAAIGRAKMGIRFTVGDSALGKVLVAATERASAP